MVTLYYNGDGYLYEASINEKIFFVGIGSDYNREKGHYDLPEFNIVRMAPRHIEQYRGQDMGWSQDGVEHTFNITLHEGYERSSEIKRRYKHVQLVK